MEKGIVLGLVIVISTLIIGIIITFVIITNISQVYPNDSTSITNSTTLLLNNGSSQTLYTSGGDILSTTSKVYNLTWLNFNGIDNRVNINQSNNYSQPYSISFWIKTSNNGTTGGYPISKYSATNNRSFAFQTNSGNDIWFEVWENSSNSTNYTESRYNNFMNNDTWYFITGVMNGTHLLLYGEGSLQDTDAIPPSLPLLPGGANVTFGRTENNVGAFNGSLDDIRIYNYSLRNFQQKAIRNSSAFMYGRKIPILSYHQVNTTCPVDTLVCYTNFTQQMDYLNTSGFTTITFKDYYNWRQGTFLLPKKPVILSFDDGFLNVYTNATPIMDIYGFVGEASIITEQVGQSGRMNWTQIQDLANKGWEIAGHGSNSYLNMNTTQMAGNFSQTKNLIEGNLSGVNVITFVYPSNLHNSTTDSICGQYYTMCTGDSQGDNSPLYTYQRSNLTGGLDRLVIDNITTLSNYKEVVDEYYGLISLFPLNENGGTTAYDLSNNHNNGIIENSSYQNDGVLLTIISQLDYTLNSHTKVLTLMNYIYSFSQITVDYTYETFYTSSINGIRGNFTEGINNFSSKLPLIFSIGIIIVLISVLSILIIIWKNMEISTKI